MSDRTSLLARGVWNRRRFLPPVPTTNSWMPRSGAAMAEGVWGANRS